MVATRTFPGQQYHFFAWPESLTRRENSLQFIKYMGSKREIVDFVANTIDEAVCRQSGTVLDLMAGTSSVGYALAGNHRVIANDVQNYSYVLAQAVLRTKDEVPAADVIWEFLAPHIEENRGRLNNLLATHLKTEQELICSESFTSEFIERYTAFMAEYPHAGNLVHSGTYDGLCERFSSLIQERRVNKAAVPYCLFTLYFGNAYFGLGQAIEFDSIRYAIDKALGPGSQSWYLALSCLMHAASYCTPGPGHFAQFRAVNSPAVCEDILRYRNRSPKSYFLEKLRDFKSNYRKPAFDNLCVREDYRKALKKYLSEVDLVYADPPYSFVHYSRFYHALETLVLYDYPHCEFYGRYRSDRHQSPFCIRTKVKKAFEEIIVPTSKERKKLVISYSNTGMISLDELIHLCKSHFGHGGVRPVYSDYLHATMGRRGDKTRDVKEVLIVCGA